MRLVARDLLGVVGVVLGDVGREVDLAERGGERLAHLAHDDRGELVATLAMQLGDAADAAPRARRPEHRATCGRRHPPSRSALELPRR